MHAHRLANVLFTLAASAWLAPLAADAQVREVMSKEVSVGRSEASLGLEFRGGDRFEISLSDGSVLVNDESVGTYEAGDALDAAWRSLLGQAVALDDGPLGVALVDWSVPSELTGDDAAAARAIDEALESALRAAEVQADAEGASVSLGDPRSLLRLLLNERGRLRLLDDALANIDERVRIHVAEDVFVGADEVVEGNLVVIDGDARIEGEIDGDVVMVGGSLELLEGSSVSGSVRLADARLTRNLGSVGDEVVEVVDASDTGVDVDVDELRDELREEIRIELRDEGDFSLLAPFRPVARAVGGVIEDLLAVLILGLLGVAALAFAGDRVEVIAEAARRAPGRAAMVGFAGTILLIPAWVLGFVALLVSIVGIPVAIAWLPLFPIAACLAALVGYLAVARNTGAWLADSDLPWTQWIRKSNSLITMVGGLLGLMALFMAANVISAAPFLGFLGGLLLVAGVLVTIVAVQIGFGAVILTRAGRRREYAKYTADEAWEAAMNADVGGADDEPQVPQGGKDSANA